MKRWRQMSEKENDREQLDAMVDKLDNWNAEFEKSESSIIEAGTELKLIYREEVALSVNI
jgi:hypothetical protein